MSSRPQSQDPVCQAIETYLRHLEAQGSGRLTIERGEPGSRMRFGEFEVDGENDEVALVRLASLMIEDEAHREVLVKVLRAPMKGPPPKLN